MASTMEPRPSYVARLLDRDVWLLVTQEGGSDPEGKGGVVVVELGGSSCRWLLYDPGDHEGSLERLRAARAFHAGG
jgi:hypothetical protein